MKTILVLNGPNLNLLGDREPKHYGQLSLQAINEALQLLLTDQGYGFETLQSNAEHELIDQIHAAKAKNIDFIIFNPAAFTHTSIALRDALLAIAIPFIEVHLSNVHARESFRHHSYFSDIAIGTIAGLGAMGYELAVRAGVEYLEARALS